MTPALPPTAHALIAATAAEYETTVEAMFMPWPRGADADAARAAAIQRLSNEEIDGRFRYSMRDLQTWFGVSRSRISKYRRRADDYVKRKTRATG